MAVAVVDEVLLVAGMVSKDSASVAVAGTGIAVAAAAVPAVGIGTEDTAGGHGKASWA